MNKAYLISAAGFVLAILLNACATTQTAQTGTADAAGESSKELTLAEKVKQKAREQKALERARQNAYFQQPLRTPVTEPAPGLPAGKNPVIAGTGNFLNKEAATRPIVRTQPEGEITLNFELADIRDVTKVVFDTLQENYILDPGVQGEVSVQTSRPLPKDSLLPVLETLLRQVGATIVHSEGIYKVVPISDAVRGNVSPRLINSRLPPGYNVRIFPLRYISVVEMQTILEPFAPEGGILLVDPIRNLLVLAGTSNELQYLQETIEIFDVNWLKGMSVALYVLQNVEAGEIAGEMEKLFGPNSGLPFAGMFRFIPISRLNAILAITPQAEFLEEASVWIERLDGSGGERLYVYHVQNSDAEYLSSLLNQIFEQSVQSSSVGSTSGQVAPGQTPAQISSPAASDRQSNRKNKNGETNNMLLESDERILQARLDEDEMPPLVPAGFQSNIDTLGGVTASVRIIADTENNALLVWATSQDYDKLLNALRKLDVPKRQVLIEATIAEVTLTDELEYGVKWWFENDVSGEYTGTGSFDLGINTPVDSVVGNGFTYAISDGANIVRALLQALATESRVRILSSPQLLVIDNQQAKIQVGDQVPVVLSSTTTDGGNTTQNVQFKDTGVNLDVKPQINAGGLVTMDIVQEVTDIGEVVDGTTQPSFLQRKINSIVAIQSGQTVVLGGLIRERAADGERGVPVLHKIPVVGSLFGTKNIDFRRTELIVLITPRVIQNSNTAVEITNELRERMKGVVPLQSPWETQISDDPGVLRRELGKELKQGN